MSTIISDLGRRANKSPVPKSNMEVAEPVAKTLPATCAGSRSGLPTRAAFLLGDLLALGLSVVLATAASNLIYGAGWTTFTASQAKLFALWAVGLLIVAKLGRTYSAIPPRPVRQFRGWVLGAIATCAALLAVAWLFDLAARAELAALVIATAFGVILASFNRAMCRILFGKSRWWGTRLIVLGDSGLAATAYAVLSREPQWGLRPVGFIADEPGPLAVDAKSGYLGPRSELEPLARELDVDRALVSVHTFESDDLADLFKRPQGPIRHWIILPSLERFPCMWMQECETARLPAMSITNRLALPWSFALKRAFDLAIVFCTGPFVLTAMAVISVLVRLSSTGPVFYGQERIGRYGRRFTAWKFRTMIPEADRVLTKYLEEHPDAAEEWAATHKLKSDPRITWIGGWLRSLSLDELPQIWNVLVGEMSLVGPRPIVVAEIDKYADCYQQYVQVLPGVTGLWQVSGRNNTAYEERVDLDAYYVQNWSIWLDIYILACTVKVVVLGEGAY